MVQLFGGISILHQLSKLFQSQDTEDAQTSKFLFMQKWWWQFILAPLLSTLISVALTIIFRWESNKLWIAWGTSEFAAVLFGTWGIVVGTSVKTQLKYLILAIIVILSLFFPPAMVSFFSEAPSNILPSSWIIVTLIMSIVLGSFARTIVVVTEILVGMCQVW